MVEKCRYYDGHQTVCSLMIDDLVPVAVSSNGVVDASNDWGYLMDSESSLYNYFKTFIIDKYPEIRGTFFLPLDSQNYIATDRGYMIFKREVDSAEFLDFLTRLSNRFEFAFHGYTHGYTDDDNKFIAECEHLTLERSEKIVTKTEQFSAATGINFEGGKFPAYKYNDSALKMIDKLGAKWWALNFSMINKRHPLNDIIFDDDLNIVMIPTNISGDIFKMYYNPIPINIVVRSKRIIKRVLGMTPLSPIEYLHFLYNNGFPFIIQEHFQNQRADGCKQTPSIYYDISSLDGIYTFLRGKDVWYATCGEIAHYFESYLHSTLTVIDDLHFTLSYNGIYPECFISIKTTGRVIVNTETNRRYDGICKNGYRIFNNIPKGNYTIIL